MLKSFKRFYPSFFVTCLSISLCSIPTNELLAGKNSAKNELKAQYDHHTKTWSDIVDHLPVFRKLASECSTVTEIGMRGMVSTWALLQGLSENPSPYRSYLGIDILSPPEDSLNLGAKLARGNKIAFTFWKENDMKISIPPTEFLFIDSLHTYSHLTYELETFSPNVSKYIAMHDTSHPWGYNDDSEYTGDYSEYPAYVDTTKRGLWPAVEDFLARHSEWKLLERRESSYGLTIIQRVNEGK